MVWVCKVSVSTRPPGVQRIVVADIVLSGRDAAFRFAADNVAWEELIRYKFQMLMTDMTCVLKHNGDESSKGRLDMDCRCNATRTTPIRLILSKLKVPQIVK